MLDADGTLGVPDEVAAYLPEPRDQEVRGEMVVYRDAQGVPVVELELYDGQAWLTQEQMATLYQVDRSVIAKHLKRVYDDGEIVAEATCAQYAQVRSEGNRQVERKVKYYSLEAILAVGYRVRSAQGTQFRQWATAHLSEYLVKGFTMDDERLKNLGGGSYWRELLDRIRDIRASEKVFYRQVLDLFATSQDYDPQTEVARDFFATVQNMFHYAVHGQTAAELIMSRVDADKPFAGVRSFKGEQPTVEEAQIAKNYLDDEELQRLRLIVSAYFDAAELRARMHTPTFMADWKQHLATLISAMGGQVLEGRGTRSQKQMKSKVRRELERYHVRQAEDPTSVEQAYAATVRELESKARSQTGKGN